MIKRPSPNFDERSVDTPIDMLVLHYTGMQTADAALARLCDDAAKVSAHYCIDEDGSVYALVDERYRAWHAGVASWRGRDDVNARSVGIELVNPGHEFGYKAFPQAQMASLIVLAGDVIGRYAIAQRNIVGHSDVAPSRKQDPGELFDWQALARAGIGVWPKAVPVDGDVLSDHEIQRRLHEIGYETDDLAVSLKAFQRRYRPNLIDGSADVETSALILAVMALS